MTAVDAALARLEAGVELPAEPSAYDLAQRLYGDAEGWRLYRSLLRQQERVQARFNRYLRERGKDCRVCGQHFQPRKIDQVNCPDCCAKARSLRDRR